MVIIIIIVSTCDDKNYDNSYNIYLFGIKLIIKSKFWSDIKWN